MTFQIYIKLTLSCLFNQFISLLSGLIEDLSYLIDIFIGICVHLNLFYYMMECIAMHKVKIEQLCYRLRTSFYYTF